MKSIHSLGFVAGLIVGLSVLGAVGCTDPASRPPGLASAGQLIMNGEPDTNPAHMATVALTYGPGTGYWCSGTLITEDVVLTAAHCLAGQNLSAAEVFFGPSVWGSGSI